MIQKQIPVSNKIQVKAPTPDEMIVVIILLSGLDSSSTDRVDMEMSVWKKGRRVLRALHLVMNSVTMILTLSCY